ncbi:MAG TPA: hypothetical protein ENL11_05965 [Candidatus Acetothermia bacterium]|nr:hypothetical protein [Candidatus Acetothermia bacterium]
MSRGLNISTAVSLKSEGEQDRSGDEDWMGRLEFAFSENVDQAKLNIQSKWPIDTGLSIKSWTAQSLDADLAYQLFNDALDEVGRPYAQDVYRSGDRSKSPIVEDDANPGGGRYEVNAAVERINAVVRGDAPPETDPTFAVNRLLVARMMQSLAQTETAASGGDISDHAIHP